MSRVTRNRRDFLKTSASAVAAAGMTPYIFTNSQAKAESANDKLNVASIGTSIYTDRYTGDGEHDGRGSFVGHWAGSMGNMLAVCDVERRHAERFASKYDKCDIYEDYRKVLERDDIDVVTIGTPDHWHVKIAIEAMKAGKDVYCEKPLTLTIDEGRLVRKVVKETGRICQVGTQQKSEYDSMFLKAVALARSGRLGKKLHALSSVGTSEAGGPYPTAKAPEGLNWDMWLGQAPEVPYTKKRCHYDFRYWMEYAGGQVTDWGVHHTDIALWALGGDITGICEIEGKGVYPEVENGFNVVVDFDCNMKLPNDNTIRLYSGKNELIIQGELGKIRVNRGGLTGRPIEDLTPADKDWLQDEIVKLCKGKQPGDHMANFFECVKDRSEPISDVYSHVNTVNACHMANIAMKLKRKLVWDHDRYEFTGDKEANSLIAREQRKGYEIEA